MRGKALLGATVLLVLLCTLASDAREPVSTVVGVPGFDFPPFIEWSDDGGNFTGFLRPLLDALCDLSDLECLIEPLPAVKDLVPALVNGSVDWLLTTLSVNPERAALVDFVQPYFYSAGAALYTGRATGDVLAAVGGWEQLQEEPICLIDGYYANSALLKSYGIQPVYVADLAAAAAAVIAGNCTAYAWDSGTQASGELIQVSGVAPVFTAPYGVAVTQGDMELWNRLSASLVRLMKDGNESKLLEWEKDYITDQGLLSDVELSHVVRAISFFQ